MSRRHPGAAARGGAPAPRWGRCYGRLRPLGAERPSARLEAAVPARLAGPLCRSERRPWPSVRAERVTRSESRDWPGPLRTPLRARLRGDSPSECHQRAHTPWPARHCRASPAPVRGRLGRSAPMPGSHGGPAPMERCWASPARGRRIGPSSLAGAPCHARSDLWPGHREPPCRAERAFDGLCACAVPHPFWRPSRGRSMLPRPRSALRPHPFPKPVVAAVTATGRAEGH